MKEIPLTKGKIALVDDEDFDELMKVRWQFNSTGYASRKKTVSFAKQKTCSMHREILGLTDPKIQVDHINGEKLDNRRTNLRLCTVGQNNCNRRALPNNATGLKGVYKMKNRDGWKAEIVFQGKRTRLGRFKSPEEAHAAYVAAAKEIHGEFANLGSALLQANGATK